MTTNGGHEDERLRALLKKLPARRAPEGLEGAVLRRLRESPSGASRPAGDEPGLIVDFFRRHVYVYPAAALLIVGVITSAVYFFPVEVAEREAPQGESRMDEAPPGALPQERQSPESGSVVLSM